MNDNSNELAKNTYFNGKKFSTALAFSSKKSMEFFIDLMDKKGIQYGVLGYKKGNWVAAKMSDKGS